MSQDTDFDEPENRENINREDTLVTTSDIEGNIRSVHCSTRECNSASGMEHSTFVENLRMAASSDNNDEYSEVVNRLIGTCKIFY